MVPSAAQAVEELAGDAGAEQRRPGRPRTGSWKGAPGTGRPEPLVTKLPGAVWPFRRFAVLGWLRTEWKAMAAFSRSVPSSGNQTGAALWTVFVMSNGVWMATAQSPRAAPTQPAAA